MNNISVLSALLVLPLISCGLPPSTSPSPGDISTNVSATPQGSPPVLIEEKIECTHFVSPTGDDTQPGGESQPWASFQHAVDSARPGDTICFREGIYEVDDSVHVANSGTAAEPLVITAYPSERPILDGKGVVGDLLILDQHASYLRISGFTLRNFTSWGLDMNGENRYIRLDHLTVEGGEAGLHFTYGEDDLAPPSGGPVEHITLEDSLVINSQYTAVDCTPGPCNSMIFRRLEVYGSGLGGEASFSADGIAVSRGYPVLVEDCFIHDNAGDGIDLNSRDRQGYASGVIVRRNKVIRNHQNGIKLWAGGRMENNLVWGQGNSAVWIGTFNSSLEVINNTIAFNMWDPAYSGRNWAFSTGYPEEIVPLPQVDLLLVNNIFAFNSGPEVGEPTGIYFGPGVQLIEHHNLYFSSLDNEITAEFLEVDFSRQDLASGVWVSRTGQGVSNLTQDPLFTFGWPQVDLSLRNLSPAIDSGDNDSCPQQDAFGHIRPRDGNGDGQEICDIGALERQE